MTRNRFRPILGVIALAMCLTSQAFGVVAYDVPNGTDGNQNFPGALGTSFNTNHAVVITRLGAFDDDSNGIAVGTTLTTNLWNRVTPTAPLATETFTNGSPGTLEGAYRFKPIAPVILPYSFSGMIATGGYNGAEENGNQGSVSLGLTENTGGGLVTYVEFNRFRGDNNPAAFPTNVDGGPTTRYLAGNFDFAPANIAYEVASGVVGNQAFGGSLGMDFDVTSPMRITELGVFDSSSNGLSIPITAHVYDRNNPGAPLATINFAAGNDGTLIGGSRFKLLNDPLVLLPGFQGTIVAEGYGTSEPNGNRGIGALNLNTFNGGLFNFVGGGRFGAAGAFPGGVDGGPADRYAAGTFRFEAFTPLPEPGTVGLLLVGAAGLLRRRRSVA